MRYLYILIVGLLCSCSETVEAPRYETYPDLLTEEQLKADPGLLGGIYKAYPGPEDVALTPAPDGYTPLYISHYGRHGSRFQPTEERYQNSLAVLESAEMNDNITEYGKSLIPGLKQLCEYAKGRGGQLSDLGEQQHRDIAKRMYERFPEVFARHRHISARSSVSPRCIASMKAFTGQLLAEDMSLDILTESDTAYMRYIAYDTPEQRAFSHSKDGWATDYNNFKMDALKMDRFMKGLFLNAEGMDTLSIYVTAYYLAIGMQDLDIDVDLSGLFTVQELFDSYRSFNYRMYVCNGACPVNQGISPRSASTLLYNFITSADAAIASDTVSATLRFGHDSNILRLMALMHMHNAANQEADPEKYWTAWQDCVLSPMAANVQLVFYRNAADSSKPVLVKLLHNENEILLDAEVKPVTGPYYDWNEVKTYWMSQIELPNSEDNSFTINIQ